MLGTDAQTKRILVRPLPTMVSDGAALRMSDATRMAMPDVQVKNQRRME
jgi:hypothetical protein